MGGGTAEVSDMRVFSIWAVMAMVLGLGGAARADVFNLPHFVTSGEFAIGLEPELTLSNGAGFGANLRYTQGLTDLFDVSGEIGTGGGPRQFRVGGDLDLDIFPDVTGQPGIGLAGRALYVRVPTPGSAVPGDVSGTVELTLIPYIHKAFTTADKGMIDPFFSFPIGMSFFNGQYQGLATAVIGALIRGSDHFWYSTEFGIAVNNTNTYFAGGITYYH